MDSAIRAMLGMYRDVRMTYAYMCHDCGERVDDELTVNGNYPYCNYAPNGDI